MDKLITLNDQERHAINDFLSENWIAFLEMAENHLSIDELDRLEEKLDGTPPEE